MAIGTGGAKGQNFPSHVNSRSDCSSFVPLTSYGDPPFNLLWLWKLASEGLGNDKRSSADRRYAKRSRAQETKHYLQSVPDCLNHPDFFVRVRLRRLGHEHETEFVNDFFISVKSGECEFRASGHWQADYADGLGDKYWKRRSKHCEDDRVGHSFHSSKDNSAGFSGRPILECCDFRNSDHSGCADRSVDGTRRWRKHAGICELVRNGSDFTATAFG